MFYIFHFLKNSEKCCGIGGEGLETFQNQAASWSQKIIPFELKERNFTEVLNGLKLLLIHRVVLAIEKKKDFSGKTWLINLSESSSEENVRTLSSVYSLEYATRSVVGDIRTLEKKFFNCNKIRSVDNEACNDGGLAEITREDTADKIQEGKNVL